MRSLFETALGVDESGRERSLTNSPWDEVVYICILLGGTCPLHVASSEAASLASPVHDPRGGKSDTVRLA